MNVLIIEDEPAIADVLKETLAMAGHTCFHAADLKKAERVLEKESIEGITLDNMLPGGRGIFWLTRLATLHPELVARTVVFTGIHLSNFELDLVERFKVPVLEKPVGLPQLAETLAGLGKARTTKERGTD